MELQAESRAFRARAGFRRRWERIARAAGGRFDEIVVDGEPIVAVDLGARSAPCVLLTAGIHGDEPAAVAALAALVRDGRLDARFGYRIVPCVNPSGLRARTRGNRDGDDVNRSFAGTGSTPEARACITLIERRRYVLSIDLHEDAEARGFYAYAAARGTFRLPGRGVAAAFERAAYPLQAVGADFDLGFAGPAEAYAELGRGWVASTFAQQCEAFAGWPLTTRVLAEHAGRALIFETPRRASPAARVRMHALAVDTALAQLD